MRGKETKVHGVCEHSLVKQSSFMAKGSKSPDNLSDMTGYICSDGMGGQNLVFGVGDSEAVA